MKQQILFNKKFLLANTIASLVCLPIGQAYAACTLTSGAAYSCSGSNSSGPTINANEATVTAASGFTVDTTDINALAIIGNGALSYTDTNGASLSSTDTSGIGLLIHSLGDDGGTPGSVNVNIGSGSVLNSSTPSSMGLDASNAGTGSISVTFDGTVYGVDDGLHVTNSSNGTDLTIHTGADTNFGFTQFNMYAQGPSTVGIYAQNLGSGATTIITDGVVNGGNSGIDVENSVNGTAMNISVTAGGNVSGDGTGIIAKSYGSGPLTITNSGHIDGINGLMIYNGGGSFTNNTTGSILAAQYAIGLVGLTDNFNINLNGGIIDGNIIDDNTANGFSHVNVTGAFVTGGNFNVSSFDVGANKSLEISSGNTITTRTFASHAGSVLTFGVNSTTSYGKLIITNGAADLTGATITVDVENGNTLIAGDHVLVVDGSAAIVGGPGGTLTHVADNSILLDFSMIDGTGTGIGGDNTQLYLVASQAMFASALANPGNNANAARALQAGFNGNNPQLLAIQNNLNAAPTAQAVNQILSTTTPTVNESSRVAAENVSNNTFDLATIRLAEIDQGGIEDSLHSGTGMTAGNVSHGLGIWSQGFGQHVNQDDRGNIAGYNANTFGMAAGLDTTNLSDQLTLGIGFSYGRTAATSRNTNHTKSNTDSYQATLYGNYKLDAATYLDSMLGYSWNQIKEERHDIGGTPGLNAEGNYHASQFSGQAELGRHYYAGDTILTPHLLATGIHYVPQSFTETGAGGADLHVDGKALDQMKIGGGIKAGWEIKTAQGSVIKPELKADYRYAVINDPVEDTVNFTGGGTAFAAQGPTPVRSTVNLGGSLALKTTANWTFTATYDLEMRSDFMANTGLLKAAYKF